MELLARKGFDPVYGARPVKRAVQQELETTLAKALLKGNLQDEDAVVVDSNGDPNDPRLSLTVQKGGGNIQISSSDSFVPSG